MNEWPSVFIIILNWNGAEDTINCVRSFRGLRYPNYELVVVDNGSTDSSVNRIKEKFPNITLIETGNNLGYAGGNNAGIRYAINKGADYILIVNNDTELINPNFINDMIDKMEEEPTIGIIGPKILNPGGKIQDSILFTPTLLNSIRESLLFKFHRRNKKNYSIPQQVEAVSGVCWLIRKEVVEKIGLIDEDYFMYAEEQDFCYRAKKAGWGIMYYPVESILHYKGSNDENKSRNFRQYIYARRNLVLFLKKHFSFLQAVLLAVLFLSSNILKVVIARLTGKEKDFYNVFLLSTLLHEFTYILTNKEKLSK